MRSKIFVEGAEIKDNGIALSGTHDHISDVTAQNPCFIYVITSKSQICKINCKWCLVYDELHVYMMKLTTLYCSNGRAMSSQ